MQLMVYFGWKNSCDMVQVAVQAVLSPLPSSLPLDNYAMLLDLRRAAWLAAAGLGNAVLETASQQGSVTKIYQES